MSDRVEGDDEKIKKFDRRRRVIDVLQAMQARALSNDAIEVDVVLTFADGTSRYVTTRASIKEFRDG